MLTKYQVIQNVIYNKLKVLIPIFQLSSNERFSSAEQMTEIISTGKGGMGEVCGR